MTDQKKDAKYYLNRGLEKGRKGQHKEALEDFEVAIKLDAKFALAYGNRGFSKYNLNRKEEAIADYDEAVKLDPKNAVAYIVRGVAKYDLDRKEEAIEDYDEAIKIDPKDAIAYNNRGNAKSSLGRKKEAINDYDEAIRLDPKIAEVYHNRGLVKRQLGQNKEAENDFHIFIGLADESLGEFKEEARSFIKEIEDAKKKKKAKKKKAKKKKAEQKEKPEPVEPAPIPAASEKPYKDIHSAAVMFIDMCESTRTMHFYGVVHFLKMYKALENIFDGKANGNGLIYKKGLGDGFMAAFEDEVKAVQTAAEIIKALEAHNETQGDKSKINVRIGIDYGEVCRGDDNDVFGMRVNMAARIEGVQKDSVNEPSANMPERNRILVSHVVYVSIEDKWECDKVGWVNLKGFEGTLYWIYNVDWKKPKN